VRSIPRHQIVSIILLCAAAGLFISQWLYPLADTIASTASTLLNVLWIGGAIVTVLGIMPLFLALFSVWMYFTTEAERHPLSHIPPFKSANGWKTELESLPQQIENLGLEMIGAFETRKRYFANFSSTVWVYADESRNVFLELIVYTNGEYGVEIRTEYSDGFLLGTLYNIALQMDTKRFFVRSFESLHEAWDYHQYQAQMLEAEHGQAVRFDTFTAYLGTPEKEINEKKAIALEGTIAHLSLAKRSILALAVLSAVQVLSPPLNSITTTASVALLLLAVAFWFVDFITPPQKVLQTMEQRKKQKA
jgi:hypothetical protein